jgi:hypothetical protein
MRLEERELPGHTAGKDAETAGRRASETTGAPRWGRPK